ncbi:MAG TPA: hypothetical protein VF282_08390 [Bacillota bacterium]
MNSLVVVDTPRMVRRFRRYGRLAATTAADAETADIVVNWAGRTAPDALPPATRVLNSPAALALWQNRHIRRRLLRMYGLRLARGGGERFRAHVFDAQVLILLRGRVRRGRLRFRRVHSIRSKEMKAVVEHAQRAVAALRLDFGVVDLVLRRKDPYVVRVRPTPPGTPVAVRRYAAAIRDFARVWSRRTGTFLIGADPEFMLVHRRTRRLIVASYYLRKEGALGLDNQRLTGSRSRRPIAEVRPRPAAEPEQVVQRIRRLLRRMPRRLRRGNVRWCAGSGPRGNYPIGGHIHFSGLPLTAGLVRALDTYLALPLAMVEDPRRARRRRRRYGFLSEVREKSWGFEYRTPPSWLVTPGYARAVLALTKLIALNWRRLERDPFLDPRVVRAFKVCDKNTLRPHFEAVWDDLTALPEYARYAADLDALAEVARSGRSWNEQRDFRLAWGLR